MRHEPAARVSEWLDGKSTENGTALPAKRLPVVSQFPVLRALSRSSFPRVPRPLAFSSSDAPFQNSEPLLPSFWLLAAGHHPSMLKYPHATAHCTKRDADAARSSSSRHQRRKAEERPLWSLSLWWRLARATGEWRAFLRTQKATFDFRSSSPIPHPPEKAKKKGKTGERTSVAVATTFAVAATAAARRRGGRGRRR